MKNIIYLLVFIATITSCSKPFPYKYQSEVQSIDCPNIDSKLIHEALYTFKNDISKYYLKEIQEKDYLDFSFSYDQYIYRGAKGNVFYKEIASTHTLLVLNELKKEKNLFIKVKEKSILNYQLDFVQCLINNIENEEIRTKILNLIDVDYLSPSVMAENYRKTTIDANNDPNYLLFVSLDTFYRRLLELETLENK